MGARQTVIDIKKIKGLFAPNVASQIAIAAPELTDQVRAVTMRSANFVPECVPAGAESKSSFQTTQLTTALS
jgi:hypothetical protein